MPQAEPMPVSRSRTIAAVRVRWTRGLCIVVTVLATLLFAPLGYASPISFTLVPSTLTASPGGTVSFMGSITNTSGVDLQASDLFFNFGGYDPNGISDITQVLGTPDFSLPNNTYSPVIDLFTATLASTASGTYSFSVVLEDINNNLSDPMTASVRTETAVTPEPSSLVLCCLGVTTMFLGTYLFRRRTLFFRLRSDS